MKFTIDTNYCTFCGACANECPSGIISIDKNNQIAEIKHSGCIECSHCGMVCPVDAVRVNGTKLTSYPANLIDGTPAQFEHIINSKRSVRKYKSEPISRKDLEDLMLTGSTTATATNSQQVKAILLEGEQVRNASMLIGRILLKAVRFGLNPAGRLLLTTFGLRRYADKNLLEDYKRRITDTIAGGSDIFFFNAPVVVILTYPTKGKRFGRTDCALAGQNMMLTAHNRGIGSCMIGFAEAALMTKGLRKKIGVSPDHRIGLIFTLGYQKPKYYRYPKRAQW